MNYRDEMRVCNNCGEKFVFTVEEKRRQEEMGLEVQAPDFCTDCRKSESKGPGLHPGIIKWYSDEKAFGFIIQADGEEIFFHRSGVTGNPAVTLTENAPVWYEVEETEKGPQAYYVHERE